MPLLPTRYAGCNPDSVYLLDLFVTPQKKLAFKILIEGNESVCFCWEVTGLLKPLAIDSLHKIQQTTLKFSRI